MQEVLVRTGGKTRLWPATLYGTLRRLIEEGLIEEADTLRDVNAADVRRRYYRLSRRGRRALTEEIARLEDLVRAARVKGRALKLGESS
jgi:DNA-binding PadR family transcriptional regulator